MAIRGRVKIYNSDTGRGVVAGKSSAADDTQEYMLAQEDLDDTYSTVEAGQEVEFDVDEQQRGKALRVKPM